MRLIDADTLRKDVEKDKDASNMPKMWYQGVEYAINHIIHAPTVDAVPLEDYKSMERTVNKLTKAIADAEPVKHGHWIEHDVGLICSECGHYTEAMYDEPFNNEFGKGWALKRPYYCGYCGAKMDEVTG